MQSGLMFIIGVLIGIALLVLLVRSRVAPQRTVTVSQIPAVVARLVQNGQDASWAVFMFSRPRGVIGGDGTLNLQYSIEQGHVGLDWVLLGPANIAEREHVSEFMEGHGYTPTTERVGNNVHYLRVEGQCIDSLGVMLLRECYGLSDSSPLDVITDGFRWQP